VLHAVFAGTGFSALTLQVVWQRVISLHAGVDLFSITTVVSAFLAGLGLGSLAGGRLADRLGPRRSIAAFAASNAVIGVFAWFSVWLFYDLYRSSISVVDGTLSAFAFHFALLLVPTTLMGLSLPLVARGVVERLDDAAPAVGRLYSLNTVGAGLGAAVTGWFLLGNLGFVSTVRLAGTVNLLAAAVVLLLRRQAGASEPRPAVAPEPRSASPASGQGRAWMALYGLTGAVALGLEIVFFRVVDALMRTNSYTFGHVLSLYLLLFGAGAAIGARVVRRVARPDRWFLALQYGVGVAALLGVLALIEVPAWVGLDGVLDRHFAADGYTTGGYRFDTAEEVARLAVVNVLGPLAVMGGAVVAMGMSFPFMQTLVTDQVDVIGRRTGALLSANIAGNVAGILLVGFVLIDRLGTAGSLRLLGALLLLPGLAAAARMPTARLRRGLGAGAVALTGALVAAFPSNERLWAFFHGAESEPTFALTEDRTCVNALKNVEGNDLLYVNAASQNGYPFDDFHVLIGLVPALVHPAPERAVSVGLGIGATPYGMAADPRVRAVEVVEICGGVVGLQSELAERGAPESRALLADRRVRISVGDGRKFLLGAGQPFDVVTVDAIRPQSAFSGSLYSVEFYELVAARLGDGGTASGWVPTERVASSVVEAFPYVLEFTVDTYHGARFFVASERPFDFDREAVLARYAALDPGRWFSPRQARSIQEFLSTAEPVVLRDGGPPRPVERTGVNRDLAPRDEYFLNNPARPPVPRVEPE
jgi:spermidine synthase